MLISGVLNTPNANGILFEILKPVEFPKLGQERLPVTLVTWCLGNSPLNIGLNTAVGVLREKAGKQ